MAGFTLLGNHSEKDIDSIGLVFEPNFFTAYGYADSSAEKLVAFHKSPLETAAFASAVGQNPALYAISFTGAYTMVPQSIANADDHKQFLEFNTDASLQNVAHEALLSPEAVLIYGQDTAAEQLVENIFPGLMLKHGVGALLTFGRRLQGTSASTRAFVHQAESLFTLMVYNKDKLLFVNTIESIHADDVKYFILFTFKQLALPNTQELCFLGDAATNLGLQNVLNNYVKIAQLPSVSGAVSIASQHTPEMLAVHWPGFYASLCAL